MTPLQQYNNDIENGYIVEDNNQYQTMLRLQRLYESLRQKQALPAWQKWLSQLSFLSRKHPQGLYIWGGVGIGKTYLMDVFFQALPAQRKLRIHFHQFMRRVHEDLKKLQGKANPLTIIAREFSLHADVICFDEFFVNDITDAMLLSGLLDALFDRRVTLVTTSNIPPDELYHNGLQRQRFLPAIALIKKNMAVIHLDSDEDYRLRTLEKEGVFFTPLNEKAERAMQHCFTQLTHHMPVDTQPLLIEERDISVIATAGEVAWFDFNVICNVPRSQIDYLEISQMFTTVLISNVPKIHGDQVNFITYLINLVDIFYDNRVKLILSAEVSIEEIYTNGNKLFEFERTKSRLLEMQSAYYLHEAHRTS